MSHCSRCILTNIHRVKFQSVSSYLDTLCQIAIGVYLPSCTVLHCSRCEITYIQLVKLHSVSTYRHTPCHISVDVYLPSYTFHIAVGAYLPTYTLSHCRRFLLPSIHPVTLQSVSTYLGNPCHFAVGAYLPTYMSHYIRCLLTDLQLFTFQSMSTYRHIEDRI